MKLLLIILLLITVKTQAQTNTQRIADLEKWRTVAKAQLKADSIAIAWIKSEKSKDSIKLINAITEINKLQTSVTTLFSQTTSLAATNNVLKDSITAVKKLIPSYLILYVDTAKGLNFKNDTLYIK